MATKLEKELNISFSTSKNLATNACSNSLMTFLGMKEKVSCNSHFFSLGLSKKSCGLANFLSHFASPFFDWNGKLLFNVVSVYAVVGAE